MIESVSLTDLSDLAVRRLLTDMQVDTPAVSNLVYRAQQAEHLWYRLEIPQDDSLVAECLHFLQRPTPSLAQAKALKNRTKRSYQHAPSTAKTDCTLLYHAVLAHTVATTQQWISTHELDAALALYRDLGLVCTDELLRRVFSTAAAGPS